MPVTDMSTRTDWRPTRASTLPGIAVTGGNAVASTPPPMVVDVPDEPGATDVVADPDGVEVEVAADVPARVVDVGVPVVAVWPDGASVVPVVLGVVVVVERVVDRGGVVVVVVGTVVVGNMVDVGEVGGGGAMPVVVAIIGAEAGLGATAVRERSTTV